MIPQLKHRHSTDTLYLDFLSALKKQGFSGDISTAYGERRVLATDNSVYEILPQACVYPRSEADLVKLCECLAEKAYKTVKVSPRGGGTGTNGQSLSDGIVVDLSRHMNKILEINAQEGWARVQAGVVKDQLNAAAARHGLFFAPELSTSNRATIGGMINTDASGQGSCLYGKTRDHILELNTVLLDGSVLHSKALNEDEFESFAEQQNRIGLAHRLIDNIEREHRERIAECFPKLNRCLTGYDLAHIRDQHGRINLNNIVCGSEGTLGFVSEAKINLLPIPALSALVVVKYGDFESSLRDASQLMQSGATSIETIDSKVLNLAMKDFIWHQVEAFFSDATAVPVAGINLVEFTADSEQALNAAMSPLLDELQSGAVSARIGYALAVGRESVNKIWAMRKRAVGLLGNAKGAARPVPFVEDTAVPPENLADFIMEFRAILDAHELDYGMFGHVDAGVLHVRPALDFRRPEHEKLAWEISDQVAALTQKYHGLLWGEHGKGLRSAYAPAFFGELYPQLQRIKSVFDPQNQLNPGKIATPSSEIALLNIDEVSTRGALDRKIAVQHWEQFDEAVYCNGNGACHNWNYNDPMCPSWKGTRLRTHTPKGRATLLKQWLRLLADNNYQTDEVLADNSVLNTLLQSPARLRNSWRKRRGEYDFSNEVYDSMAACLACKSCTGQCPIKVDVPEFRSKFLALYHTRYARPLKDHLVANLETLLPIFGRVPLVYNGLMRLPPMRWFLSKVVGFVDGPLIAKQSLSAADIKIANVPALKNLSEDERRKTVIIVQDAFTRWFETELIIDIAQCLRKLGFNPVLAPFKANGKALHVHGFLQRFRKTAAANAKHLQAYQRLGLPLVGVDPSMTLTYRAEYSKYLPQETLPKVQLLQEWLVGQTENLKAARKPFENTNFTLLPHCTESTNAAASIPQWQTIFALLGLKLTIGKVGCCGMAGTYGHEQRNRETSKEIYAQSWGPTLNQSQDPDSMLATGYSCRCQAKREQNKQLRHPLQVLNALL